ncbi:zonular occludens toxin domain-containing protein, partial [Vibrio cholerae]
YNRIKKSFKPPEDYVDDIGERIVDENGLIIMPENFEEAFQRHRKYNWDIVLCTPNISKLGSEIKSVSETAINHSSLDGI